jgi:hypothetical protein
MEYIPGTQKRLHKKARKNNSRWNSCLFGGLLHFEFHMIYWDSESLYIATESEIGRNEQLYIRLGNCFHESMLTRNTLLADQGTLGE